MDELKYFSFMEIDNGMFVGEIYQGTPDGYGIFIEPDGTYWIGNYKDGLRKGVGMFIYGPDAWSVVNYKNGECIEINSSDIYNSRRQTFQEASARFKSELWGEFLDVAMGLSKVGSDFIEMKYGSKGNAESGESGDDSGGSSSSGSKSSAKSKNSKGKGDCGTAWMSESRSYSNYETLLATGKADGSDISSIKSKMKRIRQKWEQRGCPITKSPYED